MGDVEDYSTTPASNTDDFPENQAPSTVNDGGRETQADVAAWWQRITGTVTAGGTADALTATFSPAHTALAERMIVIKAASDNATTTPTLNLDGLGAKTIVKNGNAALVAGDIQAGAILILWYSTANTNWELINPSTENGTGGIPSAALATDSTMTDWVLARTASATAGAVGTYVFASSSTASDVAFGSTRAGSALVPTSAFEDINNMQLAATITSATGSALSGTWRCMGYYDYTNVSGSTTGYGATLWLRVS